jgi:hypothetical protein
MIMLLIYEVWTLKNSNLTGLPPVRRSSVLSAWPSCRQACACHHRALPYSDRVEPRRAGHVRHLLPLSPPCKPPREAIPLSFRLTYFCRSSAHSAGATASHLPASPLGPHRVNTKCTTSVLPEQRFASSRRSPRRVPETPETPFAEPPRVPHCRSPSLAMD